MHICNNAFDKRQVITLSIGAFSDLVSFSTRIESPGLLVGTVTVISCSAILLC